MRFRFPPRAYWKADGVTLIELLLVLAMVGVLAAIALPSYNGYRERIKQAQAIREITVLQLQIKQYALDHNAYPASLAAIGNGGALDPWGRPYRYLDLTPPKAMGSARKDHRLNPINSDFDLYSVGKDGLTQLQLTQKSSLDDIVRAADGVYVGLAANYSP